MDLYLKKDICLSDAVKKQETNSYLVKGYINELMYECSFFQINFCSIISQCEMNNSEHNMVDLEFKDSRANSVDLYESAYGYTICKFNYFYFGHLRWSHYLHGAFQIRQEINFAKIESLRSRGTPKKRKFS